MNDLRLLVEQTLADEGRLLKEREATSRSNDVRLLTVTLAGLGLIVLIGGFSIFLVQRTSRQREAARDELEATNANLERIVAHRTADLTEANEEIQRFALYRHPRSAFAAGEHHGIHHRAGGIAQRDAG